ncbi:DUF883 family protein [Rhodobacteraceae bacterium F11138]|nr:DUF883 family protein [Rhodobacteraceae bacterium F11138]
MAQTKTALAPSDEETKALSSQLSDLRADLAGISKTLSDMGSRRGDAAVETLRDSAQSLREHGERTLQAAQSQVQEAGQQTQSAIRQQPAAAVGIAVGLGFLLGFATARK